MASTPRRCDNGSMRPVSEFLDYREFLKEFYKFKKKTSPAFSYRAMAIRAGMDVSQLYQIVKGREHLPLKFVPRFQELLDLKGSKAGYFDLLVRYGRADSDHDRRTLHEQLLAHRDATCRKLAQDEYRVFSEWYSPVLRAMATQSGFQPDPERLASRLVPVVSVEKVKEYLDLLIELGFIRQHDDGSWEASDPHLTTGLDYRSEAIRHYQMQVLQITASAIATIPRNERDISTLVVSVDESALADITEMIRDLRSRIQRRVDACNATDRIIQIAFAAVPVAKKRWEK